MSSSGTTDAGSRGRDPTITPVPRPRPTALTTRPRGRCGMRVPAAVFACTAELLFRAELIALPTEVNLLQHMYKVLDTEADRDADIQNNTDTCSHPSLIIFSTSL